MLSKFRGQSETDYCSGCKVRDGARHMPHCRFGKSVVQVKCRSCGKTQDLPAADGQVAIADLRGWLLSTDQVKCPQCQRDEVPAHMKVGPGGVQLTLPGLDPEDPQQPCSFCGGLDGDHAGWCEACPTDKPEDSTDPIPSSTNEAPQRAIDDLRSALGLDPEGGTGNPHGPLDFDLRSILDAVNGTRGEDQQRIAQCGIGVLGTLLRKNRDYGSLVLKPPTLCPSMDVGMSILVRMGDKVERIRNLMDDPTSMEVDTDTMEDLAGYAILWLVSQWRTEGLIRKDMRQG